MKLNLGNFFQENNPNIEELIPSNNGLNSNVNSFDKNFFDYLNDQKSMFCGSFDKIFQENKHDKEQEKENNINSNQNQKQVETQKEETSQRNQELSEQAVNNFSAAVTGKSLETNIIFELYLRYSRQISTKCTESWQSLDNLYKNALSNAKNSVVTMDDASKNALVGFKQVINSSMTSDEMIETYIRFAREVSINFPEASKEMEAILSQYIGNAKSTIISMDDASKNALVSFKQAISAGMTRDEMIETFIRFAREVSINYPEASNEMESLLSQFLANPRSTEMTMDDASRSALTSFRQALNTGMTSDEMLETFIRFTREVSIHYPEARKEMEALLNQLIPNCYKINDRTDDASDNAVTNFKGSISKDLTKDDLVELFLRFSREISVKYPDKHKEIVDILNQSLVTAFTPDTTIDKNSEHIVSVFKSVVGSETMDKETFERNFYLFYNQISLNHSKATTMMSEMKSTKIKDSIFKTVANTNEEQEASNLESSFDKLTQKVNTLNYKVGVENSELQKIFNKEAQKVKNESIDKLMQEKFNFDNEYLTIMRDTVNNPLALVNIKDNYLSTISDSREAPDDKEIMQTDAKKLKNWDMLRLLRREEVKNLLYEVPQEELAEILYVVPKYQLINGLAFNLKHEDQIRVLTNARFEEALLREMPRKQLIDMLPDAYEFIPLVMMLGKLENGFKNGADLIEDTVTRDFKVPNIKNETAMKEESLPFVMESLLNKTPRLADAVNPVQGKISPLKAIMNKFNNSVMQNSKLKQEKPAYTTKVEELSQIQLGDLAGEAMENMDENDLRQTSAAQRGGGIEFMNFLEDMKKVKNYYAAKSATSNLYNNQAQMLKLALIAKLSQKELLKINVYSGQDPKEMVKQMPSYVVHKQLHDLTKIQLVDSYKIIAKDMILSRIQDLPSQVLARVAAETVNPDRIYSEFANQKGQTA